MSRTSESFTVEAEEWSREDLMGTLERHLKNYFKDAPFLYSVTVTRFMEPRGPWNEKDVKYRGTATAEAVLTL